MKALRQQILLMAPTNGRVLIYGESGTGKELVAHAIHAQSLRKNEMFVELNCAAIPEDLIESELFGHRKGSFPAATADKEGKFHRAHGGTLFLDEIGDMSLKTQSKVLRTLDEQRFTPVGSDEPVTVDARLIASTNKDLTKRFPAAIFARTCFTVSTSFPSRSRRASARGHPAAGPSFSEGIFRYLAAGRARLPTTPVRP
jgi:two-component system nitrogen regulation response regulator NtrX